MLLTVTFNLQTTRTLCRSTRLSGEEASRKEKSDTKSDEKEKRNTRKKENTDIGQGTSSGSAKRASTRTSHGAKMYLSSWTRVTVTSSPLYLLTKRHVTFGS